MTNTTQELKDALQKYAVFFRYHKKEGEYRQALGTTQLAGIPTAKHPKGLSTPSKEVITYFDLEKNEYRSFRKDLFIGIVYVFK